MAVYSTDKIGWSPILRIAYKCATGGNYEEAIKYYKEALKEGTNEVLIYNNLADTYMNAGQPEVALICAEEAVKRVENEPVPYVTLGEIYQTKSEHEQAVDCILKAQEIFEESVPELKDMAFDSTEEVIKKLSARVKFDIASKDWIRIIYLVKSMRSNYQAERDYIKRGVSWEFLFNIRNKSLSSIAQKYLWSKEKLGIKGNDSAAIASTYGAMCAIIGSPKVKVVEKKATKGSPERPFDKLRVVPSKVEGRSRGEEYSVVRMPVCWQFSVIRSMELDKEPGWVKCSCICAKQLNSIAKAINPDIDFEFSSTLPDGHEYCEGIFKIKNQISKIKNTNQNSRVSMLKNNNFRF